MKLTVYRSDGAKCTARAPEQTTVHIDPFCEANGGSTIAIVARFFVRRKRPLSDCRNYLIQYGNASAAAMDCEDGKVWLMSEQGGDIGKDISH